MAEGAAAIHLTINGRELAGEVEPRLLLSDFIRHTVRLTGTHVGCEHGACGACTVLVDGQPQRSCLIFTVQVDGAELTTVEGLAALEAPLHPVQQAFRDVHAMQCGFCTAGFVMSIVALLREQPHPSDQQLLDTLSGHLCRCTGYRGIIAAARLAERRLAGDSDGH